MPTKSDFRIHWQPMKYFFIIHWHQSETIGINFQVENVGNLKKTSQNTLAHFFNSVGSTNGKPLAHTLSQKSLAIHQFIVESYGTHSVCSWHATTKHPGTPRCEHVCPGFMETAEEQHEQFCKVIDQGLLCPRVHVYGGGGVASCFGFRQP